MNRIPVKSSQVRSIGYAEPGVLEVEFSSGAVYVYTNVPYTVYRMFLAAKSKGIFFTELIRGKYEYACTYKPEKKHDPTNENLAKDLRKSIKHGATKKKRVGM